MKLKDLDGSAALKRRRVAFRLCSWSQWQAKEGTSCSGSCSSWLSSANSVTVCNATAVLTKLTALQSSIVHIIKMLVSTLRLCR
ncbi:hypothetical protein CapIbe_013245 [Capra ibex]